MKDLMTIACLLLMGAPGWAAGVPTKMNYQGRLLDNTSVPVNNPALGMTFRIFDALAAGTQLWSEVQTVAVAQGLFNVELGAVTPLSGSVFTGAQAFLEMQVTGDPSPLSPRTPLVTAPYAFRAQYADSAATANPLILSGNAAFPGGVISATNTGGGHGVVGYSTQPGGAISGLPGLNSPLSAGVMGFSSATSSAGVLGLSSLTSTAGAGVGGIGYVGLFGIGRADIPGSLGGELISTSINGVGLFASAMSGTAISLQGVTGIAVTATDPLGVGIAIGAGGGARALLALASNNYGDYAANILQVNAVNGGTALAAFNYATASAAIYGVSLDTSLPSSGASGIGVAAQGPIGLAAGSAILGGVGVYASAPLGVGVLASGAQALRVSGNAQFDGVGNTVSFFSYVSFSGGTNLVAGGVSAPLTLSAITGGNTLSVYNTASSNTSNGVYAQISGNARAVSAVNDGAGMGVYGQGGTGVYGVATGNGYGVSGYSTDGVGVRGDSSNSLGVNGFSANSIGVYGQSSASNPGLAALYGYMSGAAQGAMGIVDGTQPGNAGVVGQYSSTVNYGMPSLSSGAGMVAMNDTVNGVGLYARATSTAGSTAIIARGGTVGLSVTALSTSGGIAIYAQSNSSWAGVASINWGAGEAFYGVSNGSLQTIFAQNSGSGPAAHFQNSGAGSTLRLGGAARIDSTTNTITMGSYVSFTAGTNLAAGGVGAPLSLTLNSAAGAPLFVNQQSSGASSAISVASQTSAILAYSSSPTASILGYSSDLSLPGPGVPFGIGVKGEGAMGVMARSSLSNGVGLFASVPSGGISGVALLADDNGSGTGILALGGAVGISATANMFSGTAGYFQGATGIVAVSSNLPIHAINTLGGGFLPAIVGEAMGTGVGVIGRNNGGNAGSLGGSVDLAHFEMGVGVQGISSVGGSSPGVHGYSDLGPGVRGDGSIGVLGSAASSSSGVGVYGNVDSGTPIIAGGAGVVGYANLITRTAMLALNPATIGTNGTTGAALFVSGSVKTSGGLLNDPAASTPTWNVNAGLNLVFGPSGSIRNGTAGVESPNDIIVSSPMVTTNSVVIITLQRAAITNVDYTVYTFAGSFRIVCGGGGLAFAPGEGFNYLIIN